MNESTEVSPGLPTPAQYQAERAELAHMEFYGQMEELGVSAIIPSIEFRRRTDGHKEAWKRVSELVLRHWLETEFRAALRDKEKILQAVAAIQVSRDNNDPPTQCMARGIASFVIDLIDPDLWKVFETPKPTDCTRGTNDNTN